MLPSRIFRHLVALTSFGFLLTFGCQNYRDQLQRGQGYYEQNQYEAAMAVWRNLEPDQGALNEAEMVRYSYLRGMTDYRLGYRKHARYWLGLAQAAEKEATPSLLEDEKNRLQKTLEELNQEVYGPNYSASKNSDAGAQSCTDSGDCDRGASCEDAVCVPSE